VSGDLFEILFVLAFVLFGLLGGRKKRPQQSRPPVSRPLPVPRSTGSPSPALRPPTMRPVASRAERRQDALLRELEGLLGGRPPAPVSRAPEPLVIHVPDPEEARTLESLEVEETARWHEGVERAVGSAETARWEAGRAREGETLETLEEAGEASHDRFHEKYGPLTMPAPAAEAAPTFRTLDLRRAVLWSEILGPPVSERYGTIADGR
jgi:hypothetical protein